MSPDQAALIKTALGSGLTVAGCIAAPYLGQMLAHLIRRPPARPQALPVPAAPSATAPAPAFSSAEETQMSWLTKNVLDPIAKDIAAFFGSGSPVSTSIKTGVATVGTAALQQADPILQTAETALEGVINTALGSLGALGEAAEIPVDLTYQLLAQALQAKLDEKLGAAQTALNNATGTTGSTGSTGATGSTGSGATPAAEPDGFAAPKPQPV